MKYIKLMVITCLGFMLLMAMVNDKPPEPMSSWVKLSGSDGKDINVNEKGAFLLVNTVGKVYEYEAPRWKEVTNLYPDRAVKFYVENMGVKAKCVDNDLWTYQAFPKQVNGKITWHFGWNLSARDCTPKDVAIDKDSMFWRIDHNGLIYRSRNVWYPVPGSDGARIAAGGGQVWLVNTVGKIYRYKNPKDKNAGWQQMPGSDGRDIAVTNDGQVFLVNTAGKIYQWNGTKWNQLDGSDGVRIAANNGKILLINTDREMYTRNY